MLNKFKVLTVILILLLLTGCAQKEIPEINVIFPAFHSKTMTKISKDFENKTGYKVNLHFVKYDDQHAEIMKSLKQDKAIYDVFSLDLIWTAEFAQKGYCKDLTDEVGSIAADIAPAVVDAFVYKDRVYAMPFILDYLTFFYNDDYLSKAGIKAPPTTLEEVYAYMKRIKDKRLVKYPWYASWNQGEILMCEYVWFTAAFGGEVFDNEGNPVFDKGAGLKALKFMKKLLDDGLVNPHSLNSNEYMAGQSFGKGLCAFTTNWASEYLEMSNPEVSRVAKHAQMGLLPISESVVGQYKNNTVSTSGFEGLAILANSKMKAEAWEYIQFISSPDNLLNELKMMPVWISAQRNPEVIKNDPLMEIKSQQLASVHHRPKTVGYFEVSAVMQRYIHKALKGEMKPEEALKRAVQEVKYTIKSN